MDGSGIFSNLGMADVLEMCSFQRRRASFSMSGSVFTTRSAKKVGTNLLAKIGLDAAENGPKRRKVYLKFLSPCTVSQIPFLGGQ